MKLFSLNNWKVEISPEALNIVDFKNLIKRDRTKNKDNAINELSFIFFFCDPRSDYLFIEDPTERMETIKEDLDIPIKWKPDELVSKAMETYLRLSTTVYSTTLDDIRIAIKNISQRLRNTDYANIDEDQVNKVTNSIKQIPILLKEFKKLEQEVLEQAEDGNISNKDRTILDNGFKSFNDIKAISSIVKE